MPEPTIENTNKPQELVNSLMEKATAKQNPAEVNPTIRAWLSIELIKDAVDAGKIMPNEAWGFAESLQNYSGVPVTIGTPEAKVFPATSILQARKPIVDGVRAAAEKEGINFDGINLSVKTTGLKVIEKFKELSKGVIEKYLPFQLTAENGTEEVFNEAKKNAAVEQMLSGKLNSLSHEQEEAIEIFFRVNFPNIVLGDLLKDWLNKNYSFR